MESTRDLKDDKAPAHLPRPTSLRAPLLYAHLLDPSLIPQPGTNEQSKEGNDEEAKEKPTPAFAFKPQLKRRPQQPKQRPGVISKPPMLNPAYLAAKAASEGNAQPSTNPAQKKPTYEDWATTTTEDQEKMDYHDAHLARKKEEAKQAKKKKQHLKRKEKQERETQKQEMRNWEGIYNPAKPNRDYAEIKMEKGSSLGLPPTYWTFYVRGIKKVPKQKRPTSGHSSSQSDKLEDAGGMTTDSENAVMDMSMTDEGRDMPPPPPRTTIPNDATGEDAYARRLAMSGGGPPGPPMHMNVGEENAKSGLMPPPPPPPPQPEAGVQAHTHPSTITISRAPVRFNNPETPSDSLKSESEFERSSGGAPSPPKTTTHPQSGNEKPPAKKGMAERVMEKYGYVKGSGLGAQGTGISTPLAVQVEKRMKKGGHEGNFIGSGGKGRIVGGKKSKEAKAAEKEEADRTGSISEVICLERLTDDMDVDYEIIEGGLHAAIGTECEKYGYVERVYIPPGGDPEGRVFVRFTSSTSAMRAVLEPQVLKGSKFAGRAIRAKYFDATKFEKEIVGT